jgi:hypothetical protein
MVIPAGKEKPVLMGLAEPVPGFFAPASAAPLREKFG